MLSLSILVSFRCLLTCILYQLGSCSQESGSIVLSVCCDCSSDPGCLGILHKDLSTVKFACVNIALGQNYMEIIKLNELSSPGEITAYLIYRMGSLR